MNEELKKHLVVLLLYTIVSLVMTLPVALNLTTHIVGSGGDPWQTLWRFEQPLSVTDLFGGGEPRLVNNSAIPWLPLHSFFGEPLGYNIIWILSFVLSGYFMFLLVGHLTKHPSAAILAGIMYMFLPFHVAHSLGHFGAMQTQWLPLAIWLTFLFIEKQTWTRAIFVAVVITMQSWTEHHYLLWYLIFVLILLAVEWKRCLITMRLYLIQKSRFLIPTALLILILAFAVLPWWPTVRLAFSAGEGLEPGFEQTVRFSADLFAFAIPASFHSLWGSPLATLFSSDFTGNVPEATHYLGLVPLLIVIFFSQRTPRKQLQLWLVVIIVFGFIALGPRLHVLGNVLSIPLPYTLVDNLPVFSFVRAVGRASVIMGMALTVLFGWVVARNIKRQHFYFLLGGLLLLEFIFVPMPLQSAQLSPVYRELLEVTGNAVIELPAATNYTIASRALYAGLGHGKTSVGNIALERGQERDDYTNGRSLPALRQLLYLRSKHLQEGRPEFHGQDLIETFADTAAYVGVGAVLVHQDSLSPVQLLAVTNFLEDQAGLTPESFGDVVLYRIPDSFLQQGDGQFQLEDGTVVIVAS